MKKRILIFAALLIFCIMTGWGVAKPIATIDNPVFTFDTIPEGFHLDHEFIIKNTGDTELNIENVLPP
ncbi:MAG: DUF1573 domain-containing protein [Desulfobacula sp.]|nr:DUF1573 domain-containing protein [Desulfobacula sp.]